MPIGDVSVVANYEYAGSDAQGAGGGVTVPEYDTPLLMIAAVVAICTVAGARLRSGRRSKHAD